jgi:hypothetical protein
VPPKTNAPLALVAATLGASGIAAGLYETAVWRPVALVALALAFAGAVAYRQAPPPAALLGIGALSALWLCALVSRTWAESVSRADTFAGRWALYAAILGFCVMGARDRAGRVVLAVATTVPVLAVAGWVLAILAAGAGGDLFVRTQLTEPVGYVNAEATYFLLAFWPLVALAEQRRAVAAAIGAGGAMAVAGLVLLTQSRGALAALMLSALFVLAVVPGRRERAWLLVAIAGGIAILGQPAADLHRDVLPTGLPEPGSMRRGGQAVLLVSGLVGLVWFAAQNAVSAAERAAAARRRVLARLPTVGLAALAAGAMAVAVVNRETIADRVSDEYHAFVDLAPVGEAERVLAGTGNRYDYWRVALSEFGGNPVGGVGAGNYQTRYFRERRSSEDIRQPHSLVLQTLAELGLLGAAALALFLGAVFTGVARGARHARSDSRERGLVVAAGGTFVAWVFQASVDWIWLFPGVTAIALCAAAVLLRVPWGRGPDPPRPAAKPVVRSVRAGVRRSVVLAATALAVAVAAVGIARQTLAQHERALAREALGGDPVEAIRRGGAALAIYEHDISSHYVRAAAFARLGQAGPARREVERALELEPNWWVTWALLGDLDVRLSKTARARREYRRALELNPRDIGLAQLAADPLGAGRSLGLQTIRP